MILFPTLILSLLITIGMIPVLKIFALRFNAMDIPNHRKMHATPMPKVGGVAMALGAVVPILLWSPGNRFVESLLLGSGVLVIFGILDDIKDLDYRGKLAGQILAALIVVGYGGLNICSVGDCLPNVVMPSFLSVPLTLLTIVGVTNAINLSDGLDGLAGGISMLIFICLGLVAFHNDMTAIALLSTAVVGAIFGFLRFNTHPAVVFMGDAGSQLLGFLAVSMALYISQNSEPISRMFPLLLLGFPILDTLTVMIERIRKGLSPFKADKNHFHHKLMRLGLNHAEAVIAIYGLQFSLVISAFLLRFYSEWLLLMLYGVFCCSVLIGFYMTDKKGWSLPQRDFLDRLIRGKLGLLNKRYVLVKAVFGMLETGTPLALFVCCLSIGAVPKYVGGVALGLIIMLGSVWLLKSRWMVGALRLTLFAVIPYLVFISHLQLPNIVSSNAQIGFHLSFGVLAFLSVLTLKFTRRQQGFKANPFDYLIIFACLIITNIPGISNVAEDVSLIAVKMITLFFAFEVLLGEKRGQVLKLTAFMVISLGAVIIKVMM